MKRRFTEDSWRKEPWLRSLVSAFKSLKTEEDIENFLRDIATLSELQAMSERLEVARLLAKGYSYRQVAKATGASTTTVTRVAQFLENGEGGYRKVLRARRHHRTVEPTEPITLASLGSPRGQSDMRTEAGGVTESSSTDAHQPSAKISPLQKYLERQKN